MAPNATGGELDSLEPLFADAERRWDAIVTARGGLTQYLLLSDWRAVADALARLRPRAETFVELGSGIGAVTIAADLLGYRATGIELEASLVAGAEALAEAHGSRATFGLGSFLPDGYAPGPQLLDAEFQAIGEGEPAWDELGEELDGFDLIFCYPWPGDEDIVLDIVHRFARPDALLLLYRAGDGVELFERGEFVELPEAVT